MPTTNETQGSRNILITGANRGIGLGLTKKYLSLGYQVIATARNPDGARELWELEHDYPQRLRLLTLDVTNEAKAQALKQDLTNTPIDLLINNAGFFPEPPADFSKLSSEAMLKAFDINVLGPMRVTQALLSNIKAGQQKVVATITSRMGSIGDNTSGGSTAYRVSKSAVNMLMKNFALEHQDITTILLHPGWVQTDMGGPDAQISIEESIQGLTHILQKVSKKDSGSFFDYRGQKLPW